MNKIEMLYYIVGVFTGMAAQCVFRKEWKWYLLYQSAALFCLMLTEAIKK